MDRKYRPHRQTAKVPAMANSSTTGSVSRVCDGRPLERGPAEVDTKGIVPRRASSVIGENLPSESIRNRICHNEFIIQVIGSMSCGGWLKGSSTTYRGVQCRAELIVHHRSGFSKSGASPPVSRGNRYGKVCHYHVTTHENSRVASYNCSNGTCRLVGLLRLLFMAGINWSDYGISQVYCGSHNNAGRKL